MNEIKTVGIVGSGKMGVDLFNYLSDFDFRLIWYTRSEDHKNTLKKTYHKKITRQLRHGIISQEVFDLRYSYQITTRMDELADCDLIIESIIEDAEIKQNLFLSLDKLTKPSCILSSNSSSIIPSDLIENGRKSRVLGLHFFYPVAFKNIVEVIASEETDEITIEKAKLFLNEIKIFFMVQNEESAFLLNRFLLQLQVTAFNLLKEYNLSYKQLDSIANKLVSEFGLFEMMDHVGHYTMYNAIRNYSRMDPEKLKYEPLLQELLNRKGRSKENKSHLFYALDMQNKDISAQTEKYILATLKDTANHFLTMYTKQYDINIFNFKKALEEYCGIVL